MCVLILMCGFILLYVNVVRRAGVCVCVCVCVCIIYDICIYAVYANVVRRAHLKASYTSGGRPHTLVEEGRMH